MTDTKERVPLAMFGSEGRIIQEWVNASGGVRIFSCACCTQKDGR